MARVVLIGQVFPQCYQLNIVQPPVDWKWEERNLVFNISVAIIQSRIEVVFILDQYHPEYLTEIHKRAFDLTKVAINLYSFGSGICFQFVFTHLIDDQGNKSPFVIQTLALSELCKSFSVSLPATDNSIDSSYATIWNMVLCDPGLFQALDDLIVSISTPHQSSINCARVVEALRRLICPNETNDAVSWQIMRDTLRIEREYLQLITNVSIKPRHGNREFIPGETTTEIVRRSWIIMDRFLQYRKGGNQILPAETFPILKSEAA